MQLPGEEPARWVGQVIESGLRPRPDYDAKSWSVGEGFVIAVQVPPVTEAPVHHLGRGRLREGYGRRRTSSGTCAPSGALLGRASGKGSGRSRGHRHRAPAARRTPIYQHGLRDVFRNAGDSLSLRHRQPSLYLPIRRVSAGRVPSAPYSRRRAGEDLVRPRSTLGSLEGSLPGGGLFESSAHATWDGSVRVLENLTRGGAVRVDDVLGFAERAWRAADDLIGELDGTGPLHLTLLVPGGVAGGPSGGREARLQRLVERRGPEAEQLASISES